MSSNGERSILSVQIFCKQQGRGVLQMWILNLFGAKTWSDFFFNYGVSALTSGVEAVWTFCRQGESISLDFCVDVFYEWSSMYNYL